MLVIPRGGNCSAAEYTYRQQRRPQYPQSPNRGGYPRASLLTHTVRASPPSSHFQPQVFVRISDLRNINSSILPQMGISSSGLYFHRQQHSPTIKTKKLITPSCPKPRRNFAACVAHHRRISTAVPDGCPANTAGNSTDKQRLYAKRARERERSRRGHVGCYGVRCFCPTGIDIRPGGEQHGWMAACGGCRVVREDRDTHVYGAGRA